MQAAFFWTINTSRTKKRQLFSQKVLECSWPSHKEDYLSSNSRGRKLVIQTCDYYSLIDWSDCFHTPEQMSHPCLLYQLESISIIKEARAKDPKFDEYWPIYSNIGVTSMTSL